MDQLRGSRVRHTNGGSLYFGNTLLRTVKQSDKLVDDNPIFSEDQDRIWQPEHGFVSENIWILICVSIEYYLSHGPLTRYVTLRVAHAPGMPGTFSPPTRVSDPDMHHSTCVTHVSWCMPGSLTSVFIWSRWRGKRSRHSRRMHDPQFCLSRKRPMVTYVYVGELVHHCFL